MEVLCSYISQLKYSHLTLLSDFHRFNIYRSGWIHNSVEYVSQWPIIVLYHCNHIYISSRCGNISNHLQLPPTQHIFTPRRFGSSQEWLSLYSSFLDSNPLYNAVFFADDTEKIICGGIFISVRIIQWSRTATSTLVQRPLFFLFTPTVTNPHWN